MSDLTLRSEAAAPKQSLRQAAAGAVGNAMEWYDFTVYGYFAATIGREFFPSSDPFSSLLASFGAFAAGFLARPFGALVFGHIGDKVGRRAAMWISALAMAVPTFLIGLLPTYHQIGAMAPALLVLLRLMQGLAVSGEMGTSVTFLVEHASRRHRGLIGSTAGVSAGVGTLIGSAVGALLTGLLSNEAVQDWGWRVPFLVGIVLSAVALYLRRTMPSGEERGKLRSSPLREAFATQWRAMLALLGMNAVGSVGFYLCFIFVTTYLRKTEHIAASTTLDINSFAMLVQLLVIPLAAALSDRIGRRPVLLAAAAGQLILAWPLFLLMHHPSPVLEVVGQTVLGSMVGCFIGVAPTLMAEMLPANVRCTTVSFSYNVGFGVLGGLTPLAALAFMRLEGNALAPAFMLMVAALVSILVILFMPETSGAVLPTTSASSVDGTDSQLRASRKA
jgi:MFS transporter, MHS family, proline/betaine transporter